MCVDDGRTAGYVHSIVCLLNDHLSSKHIFRIIMTVSFVNTLISTNVFAGESLARSGKKQSTETKHGI